MVCNGTICGENPGQNKDRKRKDQGPGAPGDIASRTKEAQTRSMREANPEASRTPLINPSREVKGMEVYMTKLGEENASLLRLIADMNGHMQGLTLGLGKVRVAKQESNHEWGERLERILQKRSPEMPLSKPL